MKLFKLVFVLLLSVLSFEAAFSQQTDKISSIDYNTVEAAFKALESNPEAETTEYEGWIIFKLKGAGKYELWSFTPPEHPAHPAAIRREIAKIGNKLLISMEVLCESKRFECDDLIEQFKQINENIRKKTEAKN